MNHKIFRILTITGLLASTLAVNKASAGCGQFSLTITNLATPEGTLFRLTAIDASGDLTGSFYPDAQFPHIFLRHADTVTFAAEVSEGFAINASGQIAGEVITSNNNVHAALLEGSTLTDLGTLGGSYGSASSINNAGQIAGVSYTANDAVLDPFLFDHGTMTDLYPSGGLRLGRSREC